MFDEVDRMILQILQQDARTSNAEIARRAGMAASAIFTRIRRLEEAGVIQDYEARLKPDEMELGLLAFLFLRTDEPAGQVETAKVLATMPEVLEVHHVAGEDCYLVKVRTRDTAALATFLRHRIGAVPGVRGTRTTIVLETLKETAKLPLPGP